MTFSSPIGIAFKFALCLTGPEIMSWNADLMASEVTLLWIYSRLDKLKK